MACLFISDLHLDDRRPESTGLFEHFVRTQAQDAEALYILGDLFEYWLGDDVRTETGDRVASALRGLTSSGVPCYFMHGNRDFLLGGAYAGRAGLQLLDEEVVIDVNGVATLLMHGDTLCTDDVAYQEIRSKLRTRKWQDEFLGSSPEEREAFVLDARRQSREHQLSLSMDIMDVNEDAVRNAFERHGVRQMIHGHTHRPAIHEHYTVNGQAQRVVLGDWYSAGSVYSVTETASNLSRI